MPCLSGLSKSFCTRSFGRAVPRRGACARRVGPGPGRVQKRHPFGQVPQAQRQARASAFASRTACG
eukprot:671678-Pyramimonas_sp.AAC.1